MHQPPPHHSSAPHRHQPPTLPVSVRVDSIIISSRPVWPHAYLPLPVVPALPVRARAAQAQTPHPVTGHKCHTTRHSLPACLVMSQAGAWCCVVPLLRAPCGAHRVRVTRVH